MKRHVTKQEVMDLFGVNFGDEVVVTRDWDGARIHYIINEEGLLQSIGHLQVIFELTVLVGCDYIVIKPKKKLGEKKCNELGACCNCPLYRLDCNATSFLSTYDKSLREILDNLKERGLDPEVYDIYKKKLDKEVSEDERVSKDS